MTSDCLFALIIWQVKHLHLFWIQGKNVDSGIEHLSLRFVWDSPRVGQHWQLVLHNMSEYTNLFVSSRGHLDCSQFFSIINKAVMRTSNFAEHNLSRHSSASPFDSKPTGFLYSLLFLCSALLCLCGHPWKVQPKGAYYSISTHAEIQSLDKHNVQIHSVLAYSYAN